ncbi:hypothetical protein [Martelella radicis]|uniref:Uncharacterized protein n=1 Tax=Martelella radicis TaxID=1397476 RepID=A0A7W6KKG3_9HYPH|nr:hypothetical protein [Martelella radicis]MBB4122946.1 hypothetical protein [Martelella radicis]
MMISSIDTSVSDTLKTHAMAFDRCRGTGANLSPGETARFAHLLHTLAKLARNMELELDVHRRWEARCKEGDALEQEALLKFEQIIADPEGKVVRPDFKGGRRS